MKLGSLFAGIGGFDLAARWMGWETAWFSEISEYANVQLARHWPGVPNLGDVRRIDVARLPAVDLLCGGFPCQPHSYAGSRRGTTDERWLWPDFLRVIRVLRPRYVVVENVPGLLTVNAGRAFGEVLGGLAEGGYAAEWDCLPAGAIGAPHLRDRLFIVAHPHGRGLQGGFFQRAHQTAVESAARRRDRFGYHYGTAWEPEPGVGLLADGVPARLVADPLRAVGAAVVPHCALQIFCQIAEAEKRLAA